MIASQDAEFLRENLGRDPRGAEEIVARCPIGHPLVVRVRSVVDDQPFPTLFWLACKNVKQQIDRLEAQGLIKELEDSFPHNHELLQILLEDHSLYSDIRNQKIHDQDRIKLEKMGIWESFQDLGVGGIQNHRRIRCLHMHMAFSLAVPSAKLATTLGLHEQISLCYS